MKFLNIILSSLILFQFLSCSGQKTSNDNKCDCAAILIPRHKTINIYDEPNGVKKYEIMNDTIKEDYFNIQIKNIQGDFAYVIASAVLYDTIPKQGWLKTEYIGIYPNNYSEDLKLYSKPNTSSEVGAVIKDPQYYPLQIKNCANEWLFVLQEGKEGWMDPSDQCSNPYSTCN
jgi:hypothetical protein